jgi:hypothetical protein
MIIEETKEYESKHGGLNQEFLKKYIMFAK